MPDEEQERFEDYLELERYIEDLQAGRVAHPPKDLSPAQARIYRMAALFRSAPPEAAVPRPEFAEELHTKLLALDKEIAEELGDEPTVPRAAIKINKTNQQPEPALAQPDTPPETSTQPPSEVPAEQVASQPAKGTPQKVRFVSRRSLLAGGAVAAASLAAGIGIGAAAYNKPPQPQAPSTPVFPYSIALNVEGPTTWHLVTTLAQLDDSVIRFATDTMVGYLTLGDDDAPVEDKGKIIAMSASCTHMGCIVQWEESDHQFHCPCHGGLFSEYGQPAAGGRLRYLAPLYRLEVMVQDGNVYVKVPAKTGV
jgi:Rieske Fe-S protein